MPLTQPKPVLKEIPVVKIRRQGETQARASIDEEQIMRMTEQLKRRKAGRPHDDDREIPPIDAFFDGKGYWIGDGNQRTEAHSRAKVAYIRAWVHQGGKLDAFVFNIQANRVHAGKQWETADGRHAAETLLKSEEATSRYSSREIAEMCGISRSTVDRLRGEMTRAHLEHAPDSTRPKPDWNPPKRTAAQELATMNPAEQLAFRKAAEEMVDCPVCKGFGKVVKAKVVGK